MADDPPESPLEPVLQQSLRLVGQLEEIEARASAFSARVASLAGGIRTVGTHAGQRLLRRAARQAASAGGQASKAATGAAIVLGAQLVGHLIEAVGESFATSRRRQALDELLQKKQELAAAKLEVLRTLIPDLEGCAAQLEQLLLRDAGLHLAPAEGERRIVLQRSLDKLADALLASRLGLARAGFLVAELGAWQQGRQTSGEAPPSLAAIEEQLGRLLLPASRFPEELDPAQPEAQLSEGALLLLRDARLYGRLAPATPALRRAARLLARRRFRARLLPLSAQARQVRPFYDRWIARNPDARQELRSRTGWLVAGLVVGLGSLGILGLLVYFLLVK